MGTHLCRKNECIFYEETKNFFCPVCTFKRDRGIPPKLLIIMLIRAREMFHLRHLVFASVVTMNMRMFSMVYDFC